MADVLIAITMASLVCSLFHAYPVLLLQRVDAEPDFPVVTTDARRRKSIL
jgi:hypothetical protein